MKQLIFLATLAGAVALGPGSRADVSVGVNIGPNGANSFYMDISNYYRVPETQIMAIHERNLPDEEMPVCLFLAQRAHVEPSVVVEQRLSGRPWMDIALGLHLDAGVFYVPVGVPLGPPFGSIYARFKGPKSHWRRLRLEDDEIVNLVNLRFMTGHYGYRPSEVVKFRGEGHRFYEARERGWHDNGLHKGWYKHGEDGEDNGRHEGWRKHHKDEDGQGEDQEEGRGRWKKHHGDENDQGGGDEGGRGHGRGDRGD
jgi:hypothetical protein